MTDTHLQCNPFPHTVVVDILDHTVVVDHTVHHTLDRRIVLDLDTDCSFVSELEVVAVVESMLEELGELHY